jgi:hypothetical protein
VVSRSWARIGDELIGHYRTVMAGRSSSSAAIPDSEVIPIKAAKLTRLRRRAS